MNAKKILITGAAGFIGYHAALYLHQRGDFVLGLDNFNDYYDPLLKKERVRQLSEKGIEVINADLCDEKKLEELFTTHPFTHVLHLAAQAGVRYATKEPGAYIKSNIQGFLILLEMLRKCPQVKLVYASSSSVYGLNEKVPFSTSDPTDQPANLYAATKKANELMAYSYHHLYGISSIGLRYFTVYGPWGRPDMAYFSFTKSILEKKPITLFNKGLMERDFTYIDDIIAGSLSALDHPGGCEVFNLGNHRPEPLLKMVSLLEELLHTKATVCFEEGVKGEVPITYAEIERSRSELGYNPTTSLEQGLASFVKWYQRYAL